jgi:Ran GTPase-activating protein (RanGAP) involved in mRNA processing and transport
MQTKILEQYTNLLNTASSFSFNIKTKKTKSLHSHSQSRKLHNVEPSPKKYISKNFSTTSSIKDLLTLKTMARSFSFCARNFNKMKIDFQKKSDSLFKSLEFTDLKKLRNNSEYIHGIKVDLLLDLYEAKCKDNKTNLISEQAFLFLENFRKNCKKQKLLLGELNLGVESAKVLAKILREEKLIPKKLNDNSIKDEIVAEEMIEEEKTDEIKEMDFITYLDLHQNNITDIGIEILSPILSSLQSLISLDLSSNSISDTSLDYIINILVNNKSIISLNLSNKLGLNRNKFSFLAFEKFSKCLQRTSTLQFLNLESLYLSKVGLKSLELGLGGEASIISLNISNTGLNLYCGKILGNILLNTNLEEIFISDNKLLDYGVRQMIEPLKGKISVLPLKRIYGAGIGVSGLGFIFFMKNLASSKRLEIMNFSRNCLRGRVFADIASFFHENKSLIELKLSSCDIDWEGARGIGVGLTKNNNIQKINLNSNCLGNEGAKGIGEGLQENNSLKWLDISDCKIGTEGMYALY